MDGFKSCCQHAGDLCVDRRRRIVWAQYHAAVVSKATFIKILRHFRHVQRSRSGWPRHHGDSRIAWSRAGLSLLLQATLQLEFWLPGAWSLGGGDVRFQTNEYPSNVSEWIHFPLSISLFTQCAIDIRTVKPAAHRCGGHWSYNAVHWMLPKETRSTCGGYAHL